MRVLGIALVAALTWSAPGTSSADDSGGAIVVVVEAPASRVHPQRLRNALQAELGVPVLSLRDPGAAEAVAVVSVALGARGDANVELRPRAGLGHLEVVAARPGRGERWLTAPIARLVQAVLRQPEQLRALCSEVLDPWPPGPPSTSTGRFELAPEVLDPFEAEATDQPLTILTEVLDPWADGGAAATHAPGTSRHAIEVADELSAPQPRGH